MTIGAPTLDASTFAARQIVRGWPKLAPEALRRRRQPRPAPPVEPRLPEDEAPPPTDVDRLLRAYHTELPFARRRAQERPDSAFRQRELLDCYRRIASMYRANGDGEAAVDACREAVVVGMQATARHPRDGRLHRALAACYREMAGAAELRGDLDAAIGADHQAIAAIERQGSVSRSGLTAELRLHLLTCFGAIARLELRRGSVPEAANAFRRAVELATGLVPAGREDEDSQARLGFAQEGLARALGRSGHRGEALEALAEALAAYERAQALEPEEPSHGRGRARCFALRRDLLLGVGDVERGLEAAREAHHAAERYSALLADPNDGQAEVAGALWGVGDAFERQGAWAEAYAQLRQAVEVWQTVARGREGDRDAQRALLLARVALGDAVARHQDPVGALALYRAALPLAHRLAGEGVEGPERERAERDLSIAHERVAEALLQTGEASSAAVESARAALWISEPLLALAPEDVRRKRDLAVGQDALGDALRHAGQLDEALEAYLAARQLRLELVAQEAGSLRVQREVYLSFIDVGYVYEAKDDLGGAQGEYESALWVAEQLVERHPGERTLLRDLAIAHERVGDVLFARGESEAASHRQLTALGLRKTLAGPGPDSSEREREVAISHERLGAIRLFAGDAQGAEEHWTVALSARETLAREDPLRVSWQADLLRSYQAMGDARVQGRELDGAHQAYLNAQATAEHLARLEPEAARWRDAAALAKERLAALREMREEQEGSRRRRLEARFAHSLRRFDLVAAIAFLRHLGYEREDVLLESSTSWASQPGLLNRIEFRRQPLSHAVLSLNTGLLSPFSPLPSYFRKVWEHAPIDDDAFLAFLRFFDHKILEAYTDSVYPERDPSVIPDWERTKADYIQLTGLRSTGSLHWLLQRVFPELGIEVGRGRLQRGLKAEAVVLGRSALGGHQTLGGRSSVGVSGLDAVLYAGSDRTPGGRSWANEVRRRLDRGVFPLLGKAGVDLTVRLVIQVQRAWARLARDETRSFLGYDRIRGERDAPREIVIFRGPAREAAARAARRRTPSGLVRLGGLAPDESGAFSADRLAG